MKISVTATLTPGALKQAITGKYAGLQNRASAALLAASNIIASMMQEEARANITSAGNFGERWTSGLNVTVSGTFPRMYLTMTEEVPFWSIFETGGVIEGNPLLWLPISGTDAAGVRAANYGDLFSARYPRPNGPPLLFAASDKKPRYFGIQSVNIPKKFNLLGSVKESVGEFARVFNEQWKAAQ